MNGNWHNSDEQELNSEGEYEPHETMSIEQLQHLVQLLDHSDVSEIELKRVSTKARDWYCVKQRLAESIDIHTQQGMLPLSLHLRKTY